jgi:hypothetical protein
MNPTPQSPEPTVLPRGQSALPLGAARYSAVKLLVAPGLLFVSAPLVQDLPHGDLVESVLLTLVMVSAVRVVGSRRKVLILALVFLTPALAGKWINHFRPDLLHPAIFLAAAVAFFVFVITRLLAFIVRAPRVDANVLCAGVAGFLMLALLWVPAYAAVARLNPHAFTLSAGPDAPALDRRRRSLSTHHVSHFSFQFSAFQLLSIALRSPVPPQPCATADAGQASAITWLVKALPFPGSFLVFFARFVVGTQARSKVSLITPARPLSSWSPWPI